MRPCILALIREQTYPLLQDHQSVFQYPHVKGMLHCLLFIDHNNQEDGGGELEATTKSNRLEATYCIEMVRYLLLQGYKHHQITVLTGQILKILQELRKMGDVQAYISELDQNDLLQENEDICNEDELYKGDENKSIRCASIDNFQGEESDIVVISLVRSNKLGAIGFLKEEQHVNVLLSRAKVLEKDPQVCFGILFSLLPFCIFVAWNVHCWQRSNASSVYKGQTRLATSS
jgi:hypothetical protein